MNSNNSHSLSGKTVAVSGSTGGLGSALCFHLASLGAAIVLADRNPVKAEALAERLRDAHADVSVRYVRVDLEDMSSVVRGADELAAIGIDYLFLSAGAYHLERKKCDTGYDNVFQINFLAPYVLAHRLKGHIESRGGRVVAVSSLSCSFAGFNASDPQYLGVRTASRVYGNAKRILTFALYRLFEGSNALAVVHPGISPTGITGGYPKVVRALIKYPMKLLFASPKRASLCILEGIFRSTDEGGWIGPRVFGVWGRARESSLSCYSRYEADTVFSFAEKTVLDLGIEG